MQETMRRPVCTALAIQVEFPSQKVMSACFATRSARSCTEAHLADNVAAICSELKTANMCASCVELYMGDRGIEKIRGFEPYDNLQSLWLNNNRLKKINNLDANFRIKALYVQVGQGWAC
eukprot:scaffold81975_cov18-Tisochrysis_lutea.AAC.2